MSPHDEYARMTPFEIAFPDEAGLEGLVEEVIQEATSRRVDPSLPGVFLTLGSVADFVHRLQAPDAPDGAMMEYGALVFQAVHFIRAGRPLYLLETSATRDIVERASSAEPRPPKPAGYLQLPQHLFWMNALGARSPESMDGLFWVASASGALHALPISGVLPDRPGFRALPLPEAPLAEAKDWLRADVRGNDDDYTSSIPGHDLDRLYSVETAGEVLKLLARFFAYLEATPVGAPVGGDAGSAGTGARGPRPSRLPYTLVRLAA
jgi:hypothetical protein